MEGGVLLVARGPVHRVDLQGPGQLGRPAEQLLVEPVAHAADRLRQRDAHRQGVGEGRQGDVMAPAADPGPHRPKRDRSPDPEAALPDRDGVDAGPTLPAPK